MSWRFLSLSFFWILVSSFCFVWMFIFPFCSKSLLWVLVSFLSLLVPWIFCFISFWVSFLCSFIFCPSSFSSVSILITRALNSPSDRLVISSSLSSLSEVLLCFRLGHISLSQSTCYVVRGRAALLATLWGRGQRGNNAARLLSCSPLYNELSCETGSFSHWVTVVHSQFWVLLTFSISPAQRV